MNFDPSTPIQLTRSVEATRIPSGEKISLASGTEVFITQALGGTYTITVPLSGLFRIGGADADALGLDAQSVAAVADSAAFNEEQVWEQLKNCYDPEIPVNIVDLGLIYSLEVSDENGGKSVLVKMTLTAPGCGMGPSIAADAQQRILTISGVTGANVELVWEPPWSPDLISPAGREKLGMN
jgi:probable FeS assembly SUF system protein SufT